MTRLLLVRHGRSAWNAQGRIQGQIDIELDEEGWQQAHQVAARIKPLDIAAIYSSPLQRARATAEAIGVQVNLPVTCDEQLVVEYYAAR